MTGALARIATDTSEIEQYSDPAAYVIEVCDRARTWLNLAHDAPIDELVNTKAQAEVIRVLTIQKEMGKDATLAAQEIVRRAERAIGLAIRRGQEEGRIQKLGEGAGPRTDYVRNGGVIHVDRPADTSKISVASLGIPSDELARSSYAMTDGVAPEIFEQAIDEALAEQNLSRANVVRKIKDKKPPLTPDQVRTERLERIQDLADQNYSSRQIAKELGISFKHLRDLAVGYDIKIPADAFVGRTKRIDSNRVVAQTVLDIASTVASLDVVEFSVLDRGQVQEWVNSLSDSRRALTKFANQLKKELTQS